MPDSCLGVDILSAYHAGGVIHLPTSEYPRPCRERLHAKSRFADKYPFFFSRINSLEMILIDNHFLPGFQASLQVVHENFLLLMDKT
jgi:hypothetical protein